MAAATASASASTMLKNGFHSSAISGGLLAPRGLSSSPLKVLSKKKTSSLVVKAIQSEKVSKLTFPKQHTEKYIIFEGLMMTGNSTN